MSDPAPILVLWVAVVLVVAGLVVAALWPVRPRRAALVLGGAVVVGLLLATAPVALHVTCLGVTYLLLLVPPVLPWRKEWARFAMPSAVLAVLALLALLLSPVVLAWLALPLIAGVVGLVAASVHRWETARDVERERLAQTAVPPPGARDGPVDDGGP